MRDQLDDAVDAGLVVMGKIDNQTDVLYCPDGATKSNFGLDLKKSTKTPSTASDQLVWDEANSLTGQWKLSVNSVGV